MNGKTENYVLDTQIGFQESLRCAVQNHTNEEELLWYREAGTVDLKSGNKINSSSVCVSSISEDDNGVTFTCKLQRNQSVSISVVLNVICEWGGNSESDCVVYTTLSGSWNLGLESMCILTFAWYCQIALFMLPQQCTRVPISPHPHKPWISSNSKNFPDWFEILLSFSKLRTRCSPFINVLAVHASFLWNACSCPLPIFPSGCIPFSYWFV